jgi:hypothetical protein
MPVLVDEHHRTAQGTGADHGCKRFLERHTQGIPLQTGRHGPSLAGDGQQVQQQGNVPFQRSIQGEHGVHGPLFQQLGRSGFHQTEASPEGIQ